MEKIKNPTGFLAVAATGTWQIPEQQRSEEQPVPGREEGGVACLLKTQDRPLQYAALRRILRWSN